MGSWQGLLSTLLGLALFSLIAVGIRLLIMQTVQQRRERQNRQINERLRTLIAAYKTLGGSFTGNLAVDPRHLKELRRLPAAAAAAEAFASAASGDGNGSDRSRRVRDAVEAALSDVILLGTEEQVRLAVQAARDMVEGRRIETAALVVSLRDFIRDVLDLAPVPAGLSPPPQGPLRVAGAGRGGNREGAAGRPRGAGGGGAGGGGGAAAGGVMGGVMLSARGDAGDMAPQGPAGP